MITPENTQASGDWDDEAILDQFREILEGEDDTTEYPDLTETERREATENKLSKASDLLYDIISNDSSGSPDRVSARIRAQYGYALGVATPDSLSKLVSRYGLTTERIRKADLSPYDEVSLLKATAYAALKRNSPESKKLFKRSIAILRHEITNGIVAPEDDSMAAMYHFVNKFSLSVFAWRAYEELLSRQDGGVIVSIDEVLNQWDTIGQDDKAHQDFSPNLRGEESEEDRLKIQFKSLLTAEMPDRLAALFVITEGLEKQFGEDASINYFEPIVFNEPGEAQQINAAGDENAGDSSLREEPELNENSAYLTPDYVIAEITQRLPDGTHVTHIVAESPIYGNACYVIRGDILNKVSQLTGQDLTWREVFRYRKEVARQLGARKFVHNPGSNVAHNVLGYFAETEENVLSALAKKWISSSKNIYDQQMEPTIHCRLPRHILASVAVRAQEVADTLKSWLPNSFPVETIESIGKTASERGMSIELVRLKEELDEVLAVNATLEDRNNQLEIEVAEKNQKLRHLQQMIQEALEP